MEAIDIVAKEYEYLNDYGQAREAAQQWARTRHRATPEEVSRMEMAPKLGSALLAPPAIGLPVDVGGCAAQISWF